MTETKKRGIIYCRVSSFEQTEGTSLDSQERMCREYAERNNVDVVEAYIERGESAKTINRTEFTRAISFCSDKKNTIDYFIVYKLDRFARNQWDHVTVSSVLHQHSVELRSVTEPIDDTPIGKAMEGMLSVFAELDNNMRAERTRQGMKERVKQGIWVWRPPLGYHRPNKRTNIQPDPMSSHFIKLAFEEYSKGVYTYQSLADFLAERGMVTDLGMKPRNQLMEKILRNPIYCGVMLVWGEQYQGVFEPIISKELWMKCQPSYSSHKGSRLAKNPAFPLRKLVICEGCKTSLTGSYSRGKKGKRYAYYHHHKQGCPDAAFIPKETFEQQFVEYLESITPDERFEKLFRAVVIDIWQNNYKTVDVRNAQLRKELVALERERQKVFELHRQGVYSDSEFEDQKRHINDRMAEKRLLVEDTTHEELNMEAVLDHCFKFIRNTAQTWLSLASDPATRLQFQQRIFTGPVEYDGKQFGTHDLSFIYNTKRTSRDEKSLLAAPRGIEPRLTA